MSLVLDTSVAIRIRDREETALRRVATSEAVLLSVVTVVELEGGVHQDRAAALIRRRRLDLMYDSLAILPFGRREAEAYASIVAQIGFSRRKVLDRMIAATALTARATLVTSNPSDFADVPGLSYEMW